jgi:hypothetical protein
MLVCTDTASLRHLSPYHHHLFEEIVSGNRGQCNYCRQSLSPNCFLEQMEICVLGLGGGGFNNETQQNVYPVNQNLPFL